MNPATLALFENDLHWHDLHWHDLQWHDFRGQDVSNDLRWHQPRLFKATRQRSCLYSGGQSLAKLLERGLGDFNALANLSERIVRILFVLK